MHKANLPEVVQAKLNDGKQESCHRKESKGDTYIQQQLCVLFHKYTSVPVDIFLFKISLSHHIGERKRFVFILYVMTVSN